MRIEAYRAGLPVDPKFVSDDQVKDYDPFTADDIRWRVRFTWLHVNGHWPVPHIPATFWEIQQKTDYIIHGHYGIHNMPGAYDRRARFEPRFFEVISEFRGVDPGI